MMREITLGQFYQTDSILHRLDPRVKITGTLVFIITLFIAGNIPAYAVATVFLAAMILLSRVPFSFIVRGMKAVVLILLVTVIFNLFLTPGIPLFTFAGISITNEGLRSAGYTAVRLTYLIIGSSLMTLTTTPNNLTDGLEKLMRPLGVINVPVHEIAMMMSIALRFIPILMEETDKIMKAQLSRGADFESGGLIKKAKALIPLLIPLFVSAFRRANDLAMAMEARCYHGGEGRTKMKPLKYNRRDAAAYVVLLLYLVLCVLAQRFGRIMIMESWTA